MGNQPEPMTQVGKVIRVFPNLGCVGIQVTERGFKKGERLYFETNRRSAPDFTITASSIQIDKEPVDQVIVGDKCAVQISADARGLPPHGTLVFLAEEKSAKDNSDDQPLCFQTENDGAC